MTQPPSGLAASAWSPKPPQSAGCASAAALDSKQATLRGAPASLDSGLDRADQAFMELALEEARAAAQEDEVPVGAVVVQGGQVLGRAHNRTRSTLDPLAHAEMLALAQAFQRSGEARLVGATVYTTLEPCFMCAGALSHARVARVVWAVRDAKFGALASLGAVLSDPRLNHRAELKEGVCSSQARDLLQSFFRSKRA